MAVNGFTMVLAAAMMLAAVPLIVFVRMSPARRSGRWLLPWISVVGFVAVAGFVVLVNFGMLTP
jgi:hypothetical protein